jgi:hypothetical protein
MDTKMTWKQRALVDLMSDISERCYCAGWLGGLEYILWHMLTDPAASREFGMGVVEDEEIADLRAISEEIGGWICWQHHAPCGERFVPMAEWLKMVEEGAGR